MTKQRETGDEEIARHAQERAWLASVASGWLHANAAMKSLQQRYQGPFRHYLQARWFSEADIDDVTQQTWLDIASKARTFDSGRVPEAWLWGFLQNQKKRALRRFAVDAKRFTSANDDELDRSGGGEATPDSPEAQRTQRDLEDCVARAFAAFRRRHYQAAWWLYLAYLDRLDLDQVADYRGSSRHAAEEFMSRARKLSRPYMAPCLALRTGKAEHTMPSSRTPPEGFSDSDQQWFARLTGKAVPDANPDAEAVREADALRLALEQQRPRLAPGESDAVDDEAIGRDWERLQFALKREGLLQPSRSRRWAWPALGGLAAALVLAVAVVPLWQATQRPDYPEPPVLRGGTPVRQVTSDDPRGAAERLAAGLRQAGLAPGLFQQDKRFLVDIVLAPEQLSPAAPAFSQFGLTPEAGLNRIVFSRQ